jgi:hypothetical protein
MIKINSPVQGGGRMWIVTHRLIDRNNWGHSVRPINILTFLGQRIAPGKDNKIFSLGMALENKLASASRSHRDFVSCATAVGDVAPDRFIRDYVDDQNFMGSLECHLHTLYATLEVVAEMNRILDPTLPMGFRKQSKKYPPFSFDQRDWLKSLYDLRSELTHYSTALPLRREGKLIIEFRSGRELELYAKGRTEIEVQEVLNYLPQLLRLLDEWASLVLKQLPDNGEVDVLKRSEFGAEPLFEKIPLSDFKKHFEKILLQQASQPLAVEPGSG